MPTQRSKEHENRCPCADSKIVGPSGLSATILIQPKGVIIRMDTEWIGNLAQDIRQKGHEAAESYGKAQHSDQIITTKGNAFFSAFVISLEEGVNEIKRQLQGDVTSSDTLFQTISPTEVKLTRSRFPWFDAHITHRDPNIVLDYAKGPGVAGDPAIDRKTASFIFQVADDDTLSLQQSFSENPISFHRPEELARHIIELLFKP
jgi:hypothetical protein